MIANIGAWTAMRIDAPLNSALTPSLFSVETSILPNDDSIDEPLAACTRVLITSMGVTNRHVLHSPLTQERGSHAGEAASGQQTPEAASAILGGE